MEIYLKNLFLILLILFIGAMIFAVIQIIFILLDIRKASRTLKSTVVEVKSKIGSLLSVFDIVAALSFLVSNFKNSISKKKKNKESDSGEGEN